MSLDDVINTAAWADAVLPNIRALAPRLLRVAALGDVALSDAVSEQQQTAGSLSSTLAAPATRIDDGTGKEWCVSRERAMCVSETGIAELCIEGTVVKRFESAGRVSTTTHGFYLRRPRNRDAMDHPLRGEEALWCDTGLYEADDALACVRDFVEQHVRGRALTEIGRVWLILDGSGRTGMRHRDHEIPSFSNEFVWLRDTSKTLTVFADDESGGRATVTSHSAWFDARYRHQGHGVDAAPASWDDTDTGEALQHEEAALGQMGTDGCSSSRPAPPIAISLRIDGRFTPELKARKRVCERWATPLGGE